MSTVPAAVRPANISEELASQLARRHDALRFPYTLKANALLERQESLESNARSYPRRLPVALRRAQGVYVEDVEGRVFIDCLAAAGTLALGHNHPTVVDAIRRVLDDGLPLQTLDLTTPVKDRFMQDLVEVLPSEFASDAKIQFCGPTGSDAVEAALKLVKTATGRGTIVAFYGAYHGMTQGALHLMGNLAPKRPLNGVLQGVQFMPYPYSYRCPFGLGGAAGTEAGLRCMETVLTDPEAGIPTPGGLIVEVVQGEGGVIPAPDSWIAGIRALTRKAGVPLVVDEIQTGLGRTGKLFAFEHAGITPDVIVLSKAIGGGLPLSVVLYRGELDKWGPGAHAGTFRGNQMAMAAGSATIRYVVAEELDRRADKLGRRLMSELRQLQSDYPHIGDVRGRGLMIGVEFVSPAGEVNSSGHRRADPAVASAVQIECLRRGLIIELGGRHGSVARFLPPLTISELQLDLVFDIFAAAVRASCAAS